MGHGHSCDSMAWAEVTALLGDMFIFFLALIQRKNVLEREEWTPELKEQQWRRWRIRTALAIKKYILKDPTPGGQQRGRCCRFPPTFNICDTCQTHFSTSVLPESEDWLSSGWAPPPTLRQAICIHHSSLQMSGQLMHST